MDREQLAALLPPVRRIARAAGEAIRAVSLEPEDVCDKADGSPLTRADLASHETILAGLRQLQPALPVLSEEGDPAGAEAGRWDAFWCVDPLDGTKEFIRGLGDYTVNIALVADAQPVLGVIHVPAADVLYWAARGLGAFRSTGGGPPERIAPNPCRTPVKAVASRSHLSPETGEYLRRLGVSETVQRGSSVKICAVADGSADVYPRLGPTCLWDTAAGAAIAREAGCRVVDLQGSDLSYDPSEGLKRPGFVVYPKSMALPPP